MPRQKTPRRVTAVGGVHLRGTPLWIDAAKRRELCIVTCVLTRMPPAHARLVTCQGIAGLLKRAGHKSTVLASPPERWLGVAGQRLQIVESGVSELASAAYIALADDHLLVTGPLRFGANDWPRVDHVVAHVPALRHHGTDLDDIADRIATRVGTSSTKASARYSVRVECLEVAAAVAKALEARGIGCSPRGLVRHLDLRAGTDIVLSLTTQKPATALCIDIATGLGTAAPGALSLQWFATPATLDGLVGSAKPKRVTLVGNREAGLALATVVTWETEPKQLVLDSHVT
ncbi:MAG: hypothetical protein H7Z43_13045 [Clostridia bacterium]|nr:hypothetical protein [Deltaproteobacteria bacterium]